MTIQNLHPRHLNRGRRHINVFNVLKKKDTVGLGSPVRSGGGDDDDNSGSVGVGSPVRGDDENDDSKSKETEKPTTDSPTSTEEEKSRATHTQEATSKLETESQKPHSTTEAKGHTRAAASSIATETAQPLITTFDSNESPTLTTSAPTSASSFAFATNHEADSTAALASPSSSAASQSSSGLSGGGKAGVAIGIIAGIGLIGALIAFFILRKRRRQSTGSQELADNEKSLPPVPPGGMTGRIKQTLGIAKPLADHDGLPQEPPRLAEVRPGSQFSPFRGRASMAPFADGIAEETPAQTAVANANSLFVTKPPTPERRSRNLTATAGSPTQSSEPNYQNPFGDPENIIVTHPEDEEEVAPRPISKDSHHNNNIKEEPAPGPSEPAQVQGPEVIANDAISEQVPKSDHQEVGSNHANDGNNSSRVQSNKANSEASVTPSAPLPSVPPPVGTPVAVPVPTSARAPAPIPTGAHGYMPAGRPSPRPNVHRVLMDFDPQMDDELPLRRGHLARLLHAYDDGWALCSLMDNSAQGVVPRTCLSPLPVKPRFRPGPGGPGPRPPFGAPQRPIGEPPHPQPTQGPRDPLQPAPLNTSVASAAPLPTSPVSPESSGSIETSMEAQSPSERSNPSANKQVESPTRTSPGPTYSTVPKNLSPVNLRVFPSIPATALPNTKFNGSTYRPYSATPPAREQLGFSPVPYSPAHSDPGLHKAGVAHGGNEKSNQLRTDTPDGGQSSRPSTLSFVTADENAMAPE
ncbi:hypothetical protein KEM56_005606 [Ascosphaera pollenicola]|nr:hypothetical protein KEM56_005606 [Ascosphaera pollenicola]